MGGLGSRVVSVLDSGAEGPRFKSQPRRCWVRVLGKLFTPIVHQTAKLVAALLRVARVTAGLAESNGSLKKVKGQVFPYLLPSVGPGADPGVQAVSPQVT